MTTYAEEMHEQDPAVVDPKCPKCGRFTSGRIYWYNGLGEVTKTTADCSRCGKVDPGIIGWSSDFRRMEV